MRIRCKARLVRDTATRSFESSRYGQVLVGAYADGEHDEIKCLRTGRCLTLDSIGSFTQRRHFAEAEINTGAAMSCGHELSDNLWNHSRQEPILTSE